MTASAVSDTSRRSRLSSVEKQIARLKRDYPLWAKFCYRIRDKHGKLIPLELNQLQRAMGRAEAQEIRTKGEARLFALKARQGGVSTDQQARNLHQIWSEPNFDALTLAQTSGDTVKIFGITQRAIEHFPRLLLPRLGERATTEISFPGIDARFFTGTAGAKRTGRGMTLKRFHGSEFAFWDDPEGTLGTVTPGLVPRGSVIVLETTASGFDSKAHNFWRECEARGYRPLFFPWWECDALNYRLPLDEPDELGKLEEDEQSLIKMQGLSLEQIKWRRAKMAELTRGIFLTEYAEDADSCWAAPGGMFFDVEILKALILRAPTPIDTQMNGDLEIFGHLEPGERAIIGSDTAEGSLTGAGDSNTFVARAFPSWRLLAGYRSARIEPKEFAGVLNTWGRFFGNALLVIEKNYHGITVLRTLRDDLHYPIASIYHRSTLDDSKNKMTLRIGWATTGESKPLMLDAGRELMAAAKQDLAGVPSRTALRDAFSVQRGDDGKYDLNGRDTLVAEMLAWIGRSAPSKMAPRFISAD